MKRYDLIEHDKNKKYIIFRERKLNENIFRIILRASHADRIYFNMQLKEKTRRRRRRWMDGKLYIHISITYISFYPLKRLYNDISR